MKFQAGSWYIAAGEVAAVGLVSLTEVGVILKNRDRLSIVGNEDVAQSIFLMVVEGMGADRKLAIPILEGKLTCHWTADKT